MTFSNHDHSKPSFQQFMFKIPKLEEKSFCSKNKYERANEEHRGCTGYVVLAWQKVILVWCISISVFHFPLPHGAKKQRQSLLETSKIITSF